MWCRSATVCLGAVAVENPTFEAGSERDGVDRREPPKEHGWTQESLMPVLRFDVGSGVRAPSVGVARAD